MAVAAGFRLRCPWLRLWLRPDKSGFASGLRLRQDSRLRQDFAESSRWHKPAGKRQLGVFLGHYKSRKQQFAYPGFQSAEKSFISSFHYGLQVQYIRPVVKEQAFQGF